MDRRERTLLSLAGLSVGDALGETFFGPSVEALARIEAQELPAGPCTFTDDTQMALSVVEVLLRRQTIDQDLLARRFAERFERHRGYGGGAQGLLARYQQGAHWQDEAPSMFSGQGSYGNGAAMRVAPLGAYFADDLDRLAGEASRSAQVTHAHPEAIAGAIAIASAAALAWEQGSSMNPYTAASFLRRVFELTPESRTRDRIGEVMALPASMHPGRVAAQVGSGQEVAAHDTVPFALYCAAHNLGDYQRAFWQTVSGLGDRDTTCAMVGGIVALSARQIPASWLNLCEPLPPEFAR